MNIPVWVWLAMGALAIPMVLLVTLKGKFKLKTFEALEEGRKPVVKFELEKGGDVIVDLYYDIAPNHVASFLDLIAKGYYNGLTFHRVVPGFVVQAGCPQGTGTGGPGYHLAAEFSDKPHLSGTLAMARTSDPDSAGSQFYFCLAPQPSLDREYTVFGQVTEGFDLVQKIEKGDIIKEIKIIA